jgi:hypothetical protein
MNTRDMENFIAQSAYAAYDGYKLHMIMHDSLLMELRDYKTEPNKVQLSKSEGDDLIFKTTPKITI